MTKRSKEYFAKKAKATLITEKSFSYWKKNVREPLFEWLAKLPQKDSLFEMEHLVSSDRYTDEDYIKLGWLKNLQRNYGKQ